MLIKASYAKGFSYQRKVLQSLLLGSLGYFSLGAPTLAVAATGTTQNIQSSNASAQIEAVDTKQAEQEQLKKLIESKPPAYKDKVMSAPELFELTTEQSEKVDEGNFQAYFLESRFNYSDFDSSKGRVSKKGDLGLRFEYLYETDNVGDLKIQAQSSQQANNLTDDSLRMEKDGVDTSFTLINNNLALTRTISADSGLGDISSELTTALRRGSHFALGLDKVRGARTMIRTDNFDLRLGRGDLGEFKGAPYTGYQKTDGQLSWIGASHKLSKEFSFGVQLNQVDGFKSKPVENGKISSAAAAFNYDSTSDYAQKLRVTVLKSQLSTGNKQQIDAQGFYLETGFQLGRYSHEFGVYKAEPSLYFGENLLDSDRQGAYWNLQREGSRFSYGGGLELEQSQLSQKQQGENAEWLNFDANFQYRINRDHSYGGNLRLQQNRYDGAKENDRRSLYVYGYYQLLNEDWGRSRFSVTVHRNEKIVSNDVAATGDELQWEQDWLGDSAKAVNTQAQLTTNLGLAHDRSNGDLQSYPTAGISGRYWPAMDWSVNASLRYSSRSGKLSSSQGLSGTVASEYKLTERILLGAALSLNQAKVETDSNGINEAQTLRSTDKSVQAYLRWEGSRGQSQGVIGSRTAGIAGSGSTIGFVFFDQNKDGQRQADETGVPNIEVYLDGVYSVFTDNRGYFEFMRVATGSHQLTLNLDTVPLPWSVKEDSLSIDVPLRGQVTANLGLTKGAE
jgi:hypothetical protein